ncbi:MAG: autotransporter outer membrane beta-barrel domain-containing protein [Planctomycetia bacterium]|nr:autotransporter outer membrane beta-barrel domain-containing protein [Planctomycetia bacterium]
MGLYALYRNCWGYLTASGNFGYSNYDTTRRIAFGGPNYLVDRSHYGRTYSTPQSLQVETAGEISFYGSQFPLRPFAGLTYDRMEIDDMTEFIILRVKIPGTVRRWSLRTTARKASRKTGILKENEYSRDGGDYVTELESSFDDLNSLRSELGARLSFCMYSDRASLGINVRASWVHEFCDTQAIVENNFTNPAQDPPGYTFSDTVSSFFVTGTDLGEDYAWVGFGMTLDSGKAWTFFGGYDGFLNGSTTLHTGNLRWE